MAEDPRAVLSEFHELFTELGMPEGLAVLVQLIRGDSVYGTPTTVEMSLGQPILDDPEDRQTFELMSLDRRVFRVWGGDLAPGEDSPDFGDALIAEANIQKAMKPGGGIRYGGKLLPIIDYTRGFAVGNVVNAWYLITQAIRLIE